MAWLAVLERWAQECSVQVGLEQGVRVCQVRVRQQQVVPVLAHCCRLHHRQPVRRPCLRRVRNRQSGGSEGLARHLRNLYIDTRKE